MINYFIQENDSKRRSIHYLDASTVIKSCILNVMD